MGPEKHGASGRFAQADRSPKQESPEAISVYCSLSRLGIASGGEGYQSSQKPGEGYAGYPY